MSTIPNTVSVIVQQSPTDYLFITGTAVGDFKTTLNLIVAVIGLFLAGVCICRMNALSPKFHKLKVRVHYLMMFAGALCVAGAPWFWPKYPRIGTVIFLITVVVSMLLSTPDWRRGPPPSAFSKPKQLELSHEPFPGRLAWYFAALRRRFRRGCALVAYLVRGYR